MGVPIAMLYLSINVTSFYRETPFLIFPPGRDRLPKGERINVLLPPCLALPKRLREGAGGRLGRG